MVLLSYHYYITIECLSMPYIRRKNWYFLHGDLSFQKNGIPQDLAIECLKAAVGLLTYISGTWHKESCTWLLFVAIFSLVNFPHFTKPTWNDINSTSVLLASPTFYPSIWRKDCNNSQTCRCNFWMIGWSSNSHHFLVISSSRNEAFTYLSGWWLKKPSWFFFQWEGLIIPYMNYGKS